MLPRARARSASTPSKTLGSSAQRTTDVGPHLVRAPPITASIGVFAPRKRDPPAARAQGEAEGDQADVVELPLRAGEQREPPSPAAPAPGQRQQPAADQVAGEVLLADPHVLARGREATGGRAGRPRAGSRSRGPPPPGRGPLRRPIVEAGEQRRAEVLAAAGDPVDRPIARRRSRRQPVVALVESAGGRLGRSQPAAIRSPSSARSRTLVRLAVEAVAGFAPARSDDPVATLPGAQRRRRNPGCAAPAPRSAPAAPRRRDRRRSLRPATQPACNHPSFCKV